MGKDNQTNPPCFIEIQNIRMLDKNPATFFTVEIMIPGTKCAIVIDNFKYHEGRLSPPQRRGGTWYYDTCALSEELANAIVPVFRRQAPELVLAEDPEKFLKWSLGSLSRLLGPGSDELVLDIHGLNFNTEESNA